MNFLDNNQSLINDTKSGIVYIMLIEDKNLLSNKFEKNISKYLDTCDDHNYFNLLFKINVDNVCIIENSVKILVKNTKYYCHKSAYEIDINILRNIITSCYELSYGLKQCVLQNDKIVENKFKQLKTTNHKLLIYIDYN